MPNTEKRNEQFSLTCARAAHFDKRKAARRVIERGLCDVNSHSPIFRLNPEQPVEVREGETSAELNPFQNIDHFIFPNQANLDLSEFQQAVKDHSQGLLRSARGK